MDPQIRLAKAEAHPIRFGIIEILRREAASVAKLGRELEFGLNQTSYHAKLLKDLDCIELVKTVPRRSTVEYFYGISAELERRRRILELSAQQCKLIVELIEDTLNDPGAPAYSAKERTELEAALQALQGDR